MQVRRKQAQLASIALALLELEDEGPYLSTGAEFRATFEARCPACGTRINKGDLITRAIHSKARDDEAIYIHIECDECELPTWPGLLENLREWLSQRNAPYIIIKTYTGRGRPQCKLCGLCSDKLADVRKFGEFPYIKRICQQCAGVNDKTGGE